MSAQIVPLFPGSRQVVRPDEEQRVAELEANVKIARAAALEAWLHARGADFEHRLGDPRKSDAENQSIYNHWYDQVKAFATWWDGTPTD